jgi:hypothetical protein
MSTTISLQRQRIDQAGDEGERDPQAQRKKARNVELKKTKEGPVWTMNIATRPASDEGEAPSRQKPSV